MASRANDTAKDTALGVKSYGSRSGYQAPINAGRPVAAPAKPEAVRAAMRADTGATRPMPVPVKRYDNSMPLASKDNAPTGIGGAVREKKLMGLVDKMVK